MCAADDDADDRDDEDVNEDEEGLGVDAPEQQEGFLGEASVPLSAAQVNSPCSPMCHPYHAPGPSGRSSLSRSLLESETAARAKRMYQSPWQRAHGRAHAGGAGAVGA